MCTLWRCDKPHRANIASQRLPESQLTIVYAKSPLNPHFLGCEVLPKVVICCFLIFDRLFLHPIMVTAKLALPPIANAYP